MVFFLKTVPDNFNNILIVSALTLLKENYQFVHCFFDKQCHFSDDEGKQMLKVSNSYCKTI